MEILSSFSIMLNGESFLFSPEGKNKELLTDEVVKEFNLVGKQLVKLTPKTKKKENPDGTTT